MNVIKMLLMGNVDVNEADSEGNTALHWCLSGGSSTQEPRFSSQKLHCPNQLIVRYLSSYISVVFCHSVGLCGSCSRMVPEFSRGTN
jgi:hypothetical protein